MLWNMNNNLVSMHDKQNQLSSGKKIHKPSDDPVGTTRVIKVKTDIAENLQYKENARDAKSWIEVSESSLMDTKDILQRVRELAVQAANGTNTEEETTKIAKEIDSLLEELVVNSNSTIAGRHLFSGFNTDEPLLNKDGTYNVDITSEKMNDFKAIAYEVAVGESMEVGVNYLDVYGAVEKENTVIDTFVFGDVSAGESRVGEVEGKASSHSKIQGPVDYKKDLMAETMTIEVNNVTYTVDTSTLNAGISQEDYVKVLLSAEQTAPPATFPPPTLEDVAEVYFVESKDPDNKTGELVIESKLFGASEITFGGSGSSFIENPKSVSGTAEVVGNIATFEGTFDYSKNYASPSKRLSFMVSGNNFFVSSTKLNGNIASDADFLDILNSAENAEGVKLGDVVDITFNSVGGISTVGKLSMQAKEKRAETITYVDEAGGFANPAVTTGKSAVQASLIGPFDKTVDLRGKALGFSYDGKTYTVNTNTLNGGATDAQVIAAIENASFGGSQLSSIATVAYDGTTLTITANNSEDFKSFSYNDSGGGFSVIPSTTAGVTPAIPNFEASLDINDIADQPLSFDFNGETYTVDTSTAPTPLTTANLQTRVQAAVNGGGNPLSGVATVNFTVESGDIGNLSIVSTTAVNSEFVINNTGLLEPSTTTVNGVAYKAPTKADLSYIVDITSDLNTGGQTLSFDVGGTTYTVAAANLDGTITHSEFVDLIKNADDGSGNLLGDAVDVELTVHEGDGSIATLKLESKTEGADTILVGGTGDIGIKYPAVTGPQTALIEGTFDFSTNLTAETLAFDVDGKTYTVDTSSFDGLITEAAFVTQIKNADDGSGNKLSEVMDVSFNLTAGSVGTLTLEKQSDASVGVTDSGSAFTGTVVKRQGSVVDTSVSVTSTKPITDAMIADDKKGVGSQSFVVTYNDTTKRIDIDMTEINTKAEMTTAINAALKDAFGINNNTPPGNNVTMELYNDGSNDYVRFTGDGNEDGSKAFLKVDVIMADKPQMIQDIEDFSDALDNNDDVGIQTFLEEVDTHLDNVLKTLADLGAKDNRLDFIENRIDDNNIAMTEILSKVYDIDYAEVTLQFKSLESVYRASLSVGARVIQPTLVDFIK